MIQKSLKMYGYQNLILAYAGVYLALSPGTLLFVNGPVDKDKSLPLLKTSMTSILFCQKGDPQLNCVSL